jgi:hypothetical protein
MNHLDVQKVFLTVHVKEDKLGKKVVWVLTLIPFYLMLKHQANQNSFEPIAAKKEGEINHGRFVQGIRNAFAT